MSTKVSSTSAKETKSKSVSAAGKISNSNSTKASSEDSGLDSSNNVGDGGVDYEAMKRKVKHSKQDELDAERQVQLLFY